MQQKVLWAEVQKETGGLKSRWKTRDLQADGRRKRKGRWRTDVSGADTTPLFSTKTSASKCTATRGKRAKVWR